MHDDTGAFHEADEPVERIKQILGEPPDFITAPPGNPTRFFGARWDAPRVDDATQVPTPVGELCLDCEDPIAAGDRGLVTPVVLDRDAAGECVTEVRPVHLECDLRGTLSHWYGQCRCYAQHPTLRAEARATLAAINEKRRSEGMGPL